MRREKKNFFYIEQIVFCCCCSTTKKKTKNWIKKLTEHLSRWTNETEQKTRGKKTKKSNNCNDDDDEILIRGVKIGRYYNIHIQWIGNAALSVVVVVVVVRVNLNVICKMNKTKLKWIGNNLPTHTHVLSDSRTWWWWSSSFWTIKMAHHHHHLHLHLTIAARKDMKQNQNYALFHENRQAKNKLHTAGL